MYIQSSYLSVIFDPESFKEAILRASLELTGVDFDAFAVTGNSGTLFGGALAYAMNKRLFLVRKAQESNHSSFHVEGDMDAGKYIFLDDFIAGGTTFKFVVSRMAKDAPETECVGSYTYHPDSGRRFRPASGPEWI